MPVDANKKQVEGQADKLKYGVSITDACINWDTTVATLQVSVCVCVDWDTTVATLQVCA